MQVNAYAVTIVVRQTDVGPNTMSLWRFNKLIYQPFHREKSLRVFSVQVSPVANEIAGHDTRRVQSKSVRRARDSDRVMRTLCSRDRTALLNTTEKKHNPRQSRQ